MTKDEIVSHLRKVNMVRSDDDKYSLLHYVNYTHTIDNAIVDLTMRENNGKNAKDKKTVSQVRREIESMI